MFNPFTWWAEYKLEKERIRAAAMAAPFASMVATVDKVMEMVNRQTSVMQTWMDSFKVTELPKSTIIRDEDEYKEEVRRERESSDFIPQEVIPDHLRQSIQNAINAGAFPELRDLVNI